MKADRLLAAFVLVAAAILLVGRFTWAQDKAPVRPAPSSPIRPLPPAKPIEPPKGTEPAPATPHAAKPAPDKAPSTAGVMGAMPDDVTKASLAQKVTLEFTDAPLSQVTDAIGAQTKLDMALIPKELDKETAPAKSDPTPPTSSPSAPATPSQPVAPAKTGAPTPTATAPGAKTAPVTPAPATPAVPRTTPGTGTTAPQSATTPSTTPAPGTTPAATAAQTPAATAAPVADPGDPHVTIHVKGISARSALDLIARDINWNWYAEDGQVIITQEALPLVAQVYNVQDLVLAQPGDAASESLDYQYESLSDIITGTLDFPLADDNGGPNQQDCSPFHGTLTIAQDQQLQSRVVGLLAAMRQSKNMAAAQYTATINAGLPISATDNSAVEKGLDKPVDSKVPGGKVDDLAKWLRLFTGAPVHIDARARTASASLALQAIETPGAPLRQALGVALADTPLTFGVDDETLIITTKTAAADLRSVRVYPVGDLIADDPESDSVDDQYARLLDVVTRTVEPDTWATLDKAKSGNAYIGYLPMAKAFVVDQSRGAHDEVADVMTKLRKAVGEQPAKPVTPAATTAKKNSLGLKIYKLNTDLPGDDFAAVVKDLVEPKSWQGEAYIHSVPGAIVVKQTPAVLRRVEKMLVDLGAIPDPKKAAPSGTPTLISRKQPTSF